MPCLSLSGTYASKELLFPLVTPFGPKFSLSPFICPEEVVKEKQINNINTGFNKIKLEV